MRSAIRFFPLASIIVVTVAGLGLGSAALLAAAPPQVGSPGVMGPAADYPVVLGEPFTVDGKTYTPADTLNYDAVGYAEEDSNGAEVSAAHRTLPLPSYIEVTSLQSGHTILVRVTRRGPMTGSLLVGLSAGAWKQLGLSPGTRVPVRVRRVNPPENERALLRLGKEAPGRMDTPPGLLGVLRRRLVGSGAVMLSGPVHPAPPGTPAGAFAGTAAPAAVPQPAPAPKATPAPKPQPKPAPKPTSATVSTAPAPRPALAPKPAVLAPVPKAGRWVVQVAAMSSKAGGDTVARAIGNGKVSRAGKFWRVRMGPYATLHDAQGALAKARKAGYPDARILQDR